MNKEGNVIILHLSDIHRTPGTELSNHDLWLTLRSDIENRFAATNRKLENWEPRLPSKDEIDLIVVSGDLTQRAGPAEFREAEQFLKILVRELLKGDSERLVLVPGNHDVSWSVSKEAYLPVTSPGPSLVREAFSHAGAYRVEDTSDLLGRTLLKRQDDVYPDRLKEFATFFNRFYDDKHSFPLENEQQQFTVFDSFTNELGVVVVGFSSCDRVDHLWRRGAINREAILKAASELDRKGYKLQGGPLRIAVWHHNIIGNPDQMDFMDYKTADLLAQEGFVLGLHGHVHEEGRQEIIGSHARIQVVWAGSFCAGGPARPYSTPMLYNVIGLRPKAREGWVHLRQRRSEKDSWRAYPAVNWGEGDRCWYPISLGPQHHSRYSWTIEDSYVQKELHQLIEHSSEIILISTGLNAVMQNDKTRKLLVQRAKKGELNATICFGNPYSPHVRNRLVEEARCEIPSQVGLDGLRKRINRMLDEAKGIPGIEVKLFNNYPTMGILRFDDEYIFYPMGYRKLGSQCPVSRVRKGDALSDFLDEMIEYYLEDAADAHEVFRTRSFYPATRSFIHPEKIRLVGIYAVPDRQSEFYKTGSELLGYDLFTGALEDNDVTDADVRHFRRFVGEAQNYAFHLTVADVMYLEKIQISGLICELEAIASTIRPFNLHLDSKLGKNTFWNNSITLNCSEKSGELERLQSEITVRLRPQALGTNYTIDPKGSFILRQPIRDEAMIKAYQSPFVLNSFHPHFTLTTSLDPPSDSDLERLEQTIDTRFRKYLAHSEAIRIDRVYVLTKPVDARFWEPVDEEKIVYLNRK
jgi:DNA repair exonuclease SbcCD nuclease subunit